MAVPVLLALAPVLFRAQGDSWPAVVAELLAVAILSLVALSVFFGVVIVGLSRAVA